MIGSIRRTLYAAGAILLAMLYAFARGRRSARRETALEAAERMAKAHTKRQEIEDDIQEDVDLYERARRAGVVRPDR